jgi:hypothetical protein
MRLGFWLGLLALSATAACGDDSGDDGASAGEDSRAVAEALTDGIAFDRGLLRSGEIPKPSADTVRLSQDEDVLRLAPGGTALMTLAVDNPEEDDPVESALIQFEDADDHIEVPAGGGDAGAEEDALSLSFELGDDLCDAFCNRLFTIRMIQAVKLVSGGISRHLVRTLELDCRQHGDADLCESDDEERDAGSGSGGAGGGGSGSTTTSRELTSAIAQVNLAACMCEAPGDNDPYCETAPYERADVTCLGDAVSADAALRAAASCLEMRLATTAGGCTCSDPACYGDVIATAIGTCSDTGDLETALEDCNIPSTPAADASP